MPAPLGRMRAQARRSLEWRCGMNSWFERAGEWSTMPLSRRRFLGVGAGLTFCFAVGYRFLYRSKPKISPGAAPRACEINAYVNVASSGVIRIYSPSSEMGQGTLTSLPLILAEELDASWDDVVVEMSPSAGEVYGDPLFLNMIVTAASRSIPGYFDRLRRFGAQARHVLLLNAADRWKIPVSELSTQPSVVLHGKSGRRMSYGEIAQFGKVPAHLPDIGPDALKRPSQFRLIGKNVPRRDVPAKTNGAAVYTIDVDVPGMLHAAVARAPIDGATIKTVDDTKARQMPGVMQVLSTDRQVAVVARSCYEALQARKELIVEWKTVGEADGFDSEEGLKLDQHLVHDLGTPAISWDVQGDIVPRFASAGRVLEREYLTDFTYHAGMEPLGAVVSVSEEGRAAEVWAGTQAPQYTINAVARVAGIDPSRVRLHRMLLGGGFGRRAVYDMDFVEDATWISAKLRKPIKVTWSREDDVRNGYFRPQSAHYIRAAIGVGGNIDAWHHRVACEDPMKRREPLLDAAWKGSPVIGMSGAEHRAFDGSSVDYAYDLPNRLVEYIPVVTGMRVYAVRGTGGTANQFAIESFLDELASELHDDPLKLRLRLLKRSLRAQRVLQTAATMAAWSTRRPKTALGLAYTHYEDSLLACIVEASVEHGTGNVHVHNCWAAVDVGIAVQPDNVRAQVEGGLIFGLSVALGERITFKQGKVQQTNFNDYPIMRMSAAPRIYVEVLSSELSPTGIGENATTVAPAALANAVSMLTGKRLRHLPITAERVKRQLTSNMSGTHDYG